MMAGLGVMRYADGGLTKGSRGADVRDLQLFLIDKGYDVGRAGADGILGQQTSRALQAFQRANGLRPTGVLDDATAQLTGGSQFQDPSLANDIAGLAAPKPQTRDFQAAPTGGLGVEYGPVDPNAVQLAPIDVPMHYHGDPFDPGREDLQPDPYGDNPYGNSGPAVGYPPDVRPAAPRPPLEGVEPMGVRRGPDGIFRIESMAPRLVTPDDRRPGFARGGRLLVSDVAGRTDRLPIMVTADSYVVPADTVSSLGQGNTMAGGRILDDIVGRFPSQRARGGRTGTGRKVPIIAAGGEYVIEPEAVAAIGGGDMKRGHDILDGMVKGVRRQSLKHISRLPAPKK